MENKEKFYVSFTKLDTAKRCMMMYYYKYIMRLEKKVAKRSIYTGEDIHKLVELFYLHRTPELMQKRIDIYQKLQEEKPVILPDKEGTIPQETSQEFKERYDAWFEKHQVAYENLLTWREYITEIIIPKFETSPDGVKNELGYNYVSELIKIMGQYEYYYSLDNLKVLDLEHKKYATLGEYNNKEVILTYISDGIVEVNGKQYLLEHKTFSSEAMSFEETWLNVQTAIYVNELNKNGWNIEGVIWDNIKSSGPKDPNVLKNGTLGKHYSHHTVFSFISPEVIMQGQAEVINEVAKYSGEAMNLAIDKNYENFLSRHVTVFNDNAVKAILRDTDVVIDIVSRDEFPLYRNMGWSSCNYCDFKDLCQLEMLGHDTKEIITTLYDERE